jgi:hypothetical protein
MVIDLAAPGESMIPNDLGLLIMGAVTVFLALVTMTLGAFIAISDRLPVIRRRRGNQQLDGKAWRLRGLGSVLGGAGLLILGSQPFLSLSWLSRAVVLGLAVILALAAVVVQVVSMLWVFTRKP